MGKGFWLCQDGRKLGSKSSASLRERFAVLPVMQVENWQRPIGAGKSFDDSADIALPGIGSFTWLTYPSLSLLEYLETSG